MTVSIQWIPGYSVNASGGSRISEEGANPGGGHQAIIWPIFPRKLHENEEILGQRDAHP